VEPVRSTALTREGLDNLLARLDADRTRAGEKYEALRRKLVELFEWRLGGARAEELADEALDRVAHKLGVVQIEDVSLYVLGVAHYILKENERASGKEAALDRLPTARIPITDPHEEEERRVEAVTRERRLECLDRCMRRLTREQGETILGYYQGAKSARIEQRRRMADQLGLSAGALRVQAHRIRCSLADCVERCLGVREASQAGCNTTDVLAP